MLLITSDVPTSCSELPLLAWFAMATRLVRHNNNTPGPSSVQVMARIRPFAARESINAGVIPFESSVQLRSDVYTFDKVLPQRSSQEEVFLGMLSSFIHAAAISISQYLYLSVP